MSRTVRTSIRRCLLRMPTAGGQPAMDSRSQGAGWKSGKSGKAVGSGSSCEPVDCLSGIEYRSCWIRDRLLILVRQTVKDIPACGPDSHYSADACRDRLIDDLFVLIYAKRGWDWMGRRHLFAPPRGNKLCQYLCESGIFGATPPQSESANGIVF